MSIAGSLDAPIEIIGGLQCDMAPSELPPGVSPDCQDVWFPKSAAETRGGLTSVFAALAGNPTVNYLKTYITLNETLRLLAYDSLGNLWKENPAGTLALVQALVGPQSPWASSTTIFGQEYLAFGDGKLGADMPRHFDDTFLDRVTQGGPGAAPTVADENTSVAIAASPTGATQPAAVAITAASANGFVATITAAGHGLSVGDVTTIAGVTPAGYNGNQTVATVIDANNFTFIAGTSGLGPGTVFGTSASATVTILTSAAHGLSATQLVTIANVGVAGYNGTFSIVKVPDATHFTYRAGAGGLAASGAGTASAAGSIVAGLHGVAQAFLLRSGAITAPGPTASWIAAGGRRAVVSGLAIGPANVAGRVLIFTGAGGASYFYIPAGASTLFSGSTVVNDNVSVSVTVDFTDTILFAATSADDLFSQIELPEVQGVIDYSERLFWWGERNTLKNWQNLGFDGGFGGNVPLGWTVDPGAAGPGGGSAVAAGGPVVWGDAYQITGDGATAVRGRITLPAVADTFGVPRIAPNVGYSVRVRVARNNALAAGTWHIHLFGTGVNTAGLAVTAAQAGLNYVEFTGVLTAALASVPADFVLRIYADGTPTNGGTFYADSIEIFPTLTPVNASLVRASRAEEPEAYDGVQGFLNVAENNGQAVRAAFKLRTRLYFVKEHSLHATSDNGQEPDTWDITEVSQRIGTPSVRGVGIGPDWVVIAHNSGLHIFAGGEPMKISQEVGHSSATKADGVTPMTLAWDQINWQYGHTVWVTVDQQEKRIYVGAPFGAATSPNFILQMDYRDIDPATADGIAGAPPITISYRGMKIVRDKSRKWSPWTISANHGAIVQRPDGTQPLFLGAGAYGNQAPGGNPTGKIYFLDQTARNDDGKTIASYYLTSFYPQRETNQMLQMHEHRKVFTYLTMYVEGAGLLQVTAFANNENFPQRLPDLRLSSPASKDLEMTIDVHAERVAFKCAADVTVPSAWFRLQKLTPSLAGDPHAPVRGQN
jgi:hypothetical protein